MMADLKTAAGRRNLVKTALLDLYPAMRDDDPALADTLAGIDDFEDQVLAVMRAALEREAMESALGKLIDDMVARKRRLASGADVMRAAVLRAIQEAGLRSIKAPDMTLSVGAGQPRVLIVDEDEIPPDLLRHPPPVPDKKAIALALAAGETVPGVALGNAPNFLVVHRR